MWHESALQQGGETDGCGGGLLGLGKRLLNGRECSQVEKRRVAGSSETTTRRFKGGYLTRSEIAFAYLLVCSMRRVSVRDYESDLTADALREVQTCRDHHLHSLDPELHVASERIAAGLRPTLSEAESALAS